MKKTINNKTFWSCIALGVIIRLAMAAVLPHNFDFDSYCVVGELVSAGKNVYANTGRYNYGPVWFIVLGLFWKAASCFTNNILAFRIFVVSTLTLADFIMASIIAKKTGNFWGALFFLNPVSMIMTGCYNQFDNVAVAIGALGVFYLEETSQHDGITICDITGIILLSLSLITKHILYAFPLWILFSSKINSRKKFLYAFIPPLVFLLSFAPYWSGGHEGILSNVFMYRSFNNYPLFAVGILKKLGVSLPSRGYIIIFTLLMVCAAYVFRHENIFTSFLLYTMSLVCFSSAVIPNYCVIPCMAMLFLFRKKSAVYFASVVFLMMCGHNVARFIIRLHGYLGIEPNAFMNFLYAEQDASGLTTIQVFIVTVITWLLLVYLVYFRRKLSEAS